MKSVSWLPIHAGTGADNMARDEMMLHRATEGQASFRVYSWAETTISLGYFQPEAERLSDPKLARCSWVRRATGGGAIVHDPATELTYSFALPPGEEWQRRGESLICQMHYLIRDLLARFGVQSRAVVCGEEVKRGPFLCFQHHTAGDLVLAGEKIAGSAQRKSHGAILQHGSILLRQSPTAPALPGIQELTGVTVSPLLLAARLAEAIPERFGWDLQGTSWSNFGGEPVRQEALARYSCSTWNSKR